ncbi:MAG: ribosomal-processing cysteine protease Prp [Clostridia bacterium]|nr:ribosomal-processing cysteine protease Prp [Clostridia bacterium]
MINATFFIKGENLSGFSLEGHSGFEDEGKDIVCAAVSSAAYMAVNTLTDVINEEAQVKESEGKLELKVACPSPTAGAVLRGLEIHLKNLSDQYPENVTVIYGGVQ